MPHNMQGLLAQGNMFPWFRVMAEKNEPYQCCVISTIFCRSRHFGAEPMYSKVNSGYKTFLNDEPFHFKYNDGVIPQLQVAYETWGELNEAKDNVVLLCTGLSASSHAKSHPVSCLLGFHNVLGWE